MIKKEQEMASRAFGNMEKVLSPACVLLALSLLSGCANIKEGVKCVAGFSTRVLEDNRKKALSKTFDYDYKTCFDKTAKALDSIGAYIYKKDFNGYLIAVYFSQTDTTPVGFFFKVVDASKTSVEVSSPSTFAKERMARRIFARIEGLTDPEEELKDKTEAISNIAETQATSIEPIQTKRLEEEKNN